MNGDLFDRKHIDPMLIAENVGPFEDPDWLYELKWDGERCIAYLDPRSGTELRNKRQMRMNSKVPELSGIHLQAKKRCILDGELLCLVNGKPDFEAIQRRSLMSNRYKIELESQRFPASYAAFDCLYYDGRDLTMLPLTERKKYLNKAIHESERLVISRTFDSSLALTLFDLARQQGLEGIVAKRSDSIYLQGKRVKTWLKIKNLMDDDFVICGFIYKENRIISLVLGQYLNGQLIYEGHVTLGVGGRPFLKIQNHKRLEYPPYDETIPMGHGNDDAIWLEPTLVCTVAYMHRTKSGGMRQPVFKGLREDKEAIECTASSPSQ